MIHLENCTRGVPEPWLQKRREQWIRRQHKDAQPEITWHMLKAYFGHEHWVWTSSETAVQQLITRLQRVIWSYEHEREERSARDRRALEEPQRERNHGAAPTGQAGSHP